MIQRLEQHCKLFRIDLRSAFRLLPSAPEDFPILGFKADNKYYFDKALVFRSSISCALFERFAKFLMFCVKSQIVSGELMPHLDDYLGGGTTLELHSRKMEV